MAVGKVSIDLEAKVSSLERDLQAATRKVDKLTGEMASSARRHMADMEKRARQMAAVVGAVAAAAFVKLGNDAIQNADKIGKLSTRLGASTEALSELQLVAEKGGISFDTLTMGLQRMTRRLSEAANGSGEAIGALQELGLSAERLNELKPEEQFELIAEAISQVENESDRVRLAMRFFDSEGVSILQTFGDEGADGIRKVREEARELGLTITQDTADAAREFNDRLTELKGGVQGFANGLVENMLPALLSMADHLETSITQLGKFLGLIEKSRVELLQDAIRELNDELEDTTDELRGLNVDGEDYEETSMKLAKRQRELRSQIKATKEALEETKKETKEAGEQNKEHGRTLEDVRGETKSTTEANKEATAQLKEYERALRQAEQEAKDFANALFKKAEGFMALRAEVDPAIGAMQTFNNKVLAYKEMLDLGIVSQEEFDTAVEKFGKDMLDAAEKSDEATKKIKDGFQDLFQLLPPGLREIAQGLVGVFDDLAQFQIGGTTLGQLAGSGAQGFGIANSVFGQGAGEGGALGSMIGTLAAPLMGPLAPFAPLIGGLLGGLFDGEDEARSDIVFGDFNVPSDDSGAGRVRSPFGDIFVRSGVDGFHKVQRQVANSIEQVLGVVAEFLSPEEIARATGLLQGNMGINQADVESGAFLDQIVRTVLSAVEDDRVRGFVGGFETTEKQLQALQAARGFFDAIDADPVQAYRDAVEDANRAMTDALRDQGQAVLDLVTNFDGSIRSMQEMGVSMQQFNQAVIQTLAGLDRASQNVSAGIQGTRESLFLQTLNDQQRFTFLTRRATELANELGGLESGEAIQSQVDRIRAMITQAFNLATPEQQRQLLGQFDPFLADVEQEAQTRIEELREEVIEIQQATQEAVTAAAESIADSANSTQGAADIIGGAAGRIDEGSGRIIQAAEKFERGAASIESSAGRLIDGITAEIGLA